MRNRLFHKSVATTGLMALSLLMPEAVSAQEDTATLEEIVVTARKRAEEIGSIPEAIAVVPSLEIENKGIVSLAGVPALVPSMSFNQFQDAATVYMSIRGVNSVRTGEPPVAMVVDGVQINDPSQINQELNDIERIEILKGPQGSLYGRNAIGGAINIVTREPGKNFEGLVRGTYKNGNDRKLETALSGPLVEDTLSFRIGGSLRDFDGLIRNTYLDRKVGSSRDDSVFGKLLFTPDDALKVELRASHFNSDYDSYYYKLAGIGRTNHEDEYDIRSSSLAPSKRKFDDAALKVDYEFDGVTLTSITGYSNSNQFRMGDLDFTPARALEVGQRFLNSAVSEEARLASNGDGPLQWVAGAFYLNKQQRLTDATYAGPDQLSSVSALPSQLDAGFTDFFDLPNMPGTFLYKRTDFRFRNTAYAVFGQADYDLTPDLTLTTGLRYDVERRVALNPNGTILFNALAGVGADVAKRRQKEYSALQPKVTLSYDLDTDSMVYGTISRGFRSGGFNNTLRAEFATYKPESLWNYEVGAKTSFWDGKARLEASAFYMDYKNRQDFFFNAVDVTQNIFNIDKSRIQGVEMNVNLRPFRGLTLDAGFGLLDTKITDFDLARLRAIDPNPAHTADGHHFSYVYHTTLNLSAQYTTAVATDTDLTVGVDYSHKARNWWWFTNLEKQEPLNLVNARIILDWRDIQIKLFAENLFNLSYVTSHDPAYAFGFPQDDVFPAEPRRYGVSLTYRF